MSLKSTFKGFLGETVINVAMWLKLEKDVYHRLNGITLPRANGGSTQIDHIIVSITSTVAEELAANSSSTTSNGVIKTLSAISCDVIVC